MKDPSALVYTREFDGTNNPTLYSRLYEEFIELSKNIKLIVIAERGSSVGKNLSCIKVRKIAKPYTLGVLYRTFVYSLATIKQRKNYDLVFVRLLSFSYLIAGIIAKQLLQKKLVVYVSGADHSQTGIKKKINQFVVRKGLSISDKIVFTSKYVIYETENFMGKKIDPTKIVNIKQGTDSIKFSPDSKSSIKDSILCVARINPEKQIEQIIEAIPYVIQPLPDVKLTIVGGVERKEYLEKLKRLISKLHCEKNVEFVDPVPYNKINRFYNSAKIFVMTSIGEGYSNATFEAMACGKPVIVTKSGARAELIKDGVNGFLIDYNNPKILAEKIILLLKDERYREEIGREARLTIQKHCDWNLFITDLSELLNKVVNDSKIVKHSNE